MSGKTLNIDALNLDAHGKTVLSDSDLEALEKSFVSPVSGGQTPTPPPPGDPSSVNKAKSCNFTTNTACTNYAGCANTNNDGCVNRSSTCSDWTLSKPIAK